MTQLIIDRFEEQWAVVEFGDKTFNMPREIFPPHIKEGDILNLTLTVEESETKKNLSQTQRLLDELMED